MNGNLFDVLHLVIEGGILVGMVKSLVHIGAVLTEVKNLKEAKIDHDQRIGAIERHLWQAAHK